MIRQLLFVAASVVAVAQTPGPRMSVPSLGYVFDNNAKAIRLISGVPGAASFDLSLGIDTAIDSAFVHSRARVAIANTKEGAVVSVRWSGGMQVSTLATSLDRVTQVAFSGPGDRAAISDGISVEVWTGLGGDPSRAVAFSPDSGVVALAMNQQGAPAIATGAGSIVLLGDEAREIATGGDWTGLAFLPNGTDLVAADASAQALVLIQNALTAPVASTLASLTQKPGALAISADGTQGVVAMADSVAVVNLANGEARTVSCGCHAARFDSLQGNLVARIVDAQSGSTLLFDADGAEPRIASLPEMNRGAAQ